MTAMSGRSPWPVVLGCAGPRLPARLDPVRPDPHAAWRASATSAIGSGNIGATNVLRTGRKELAAATLLGDALKGTAAVLIARAAAAPRPALRRRRSAPSSAISSRSGSAFKGGKGVATFSACCSALSWPALLAFAAIWLGLAFASALFVARGAGRQRPRPRSSCGVWASRGRAGALPRARRCCLVEARAQHPPAARRHRGQDRPEGLRPLRGGPVQLTDAQRLDWLRLIRSERVGPRTFRGLINRFGGAGGRARGPAGPRRAGAAGAIEPPTRDEAEAEMAAAARLGVRFVAMGEAGLSEDPAGRSIRRRRSIAVRGAAEVLARPARRHRRLAQRLGRRPDLHRAAGARPGRGRLRRRLGPGARHRRPRPRGARCDRHGRGARRRARPDLSGRDHAGLVEAILEAGGAVVSEMPIGWEPRGRDFPRRNRIVSGLAYGTVVVKGTGPT